MYIVLIVFYLGGKQTTVLTSSQTILMIDAIGNVQEACLTMCVCVYLIYLPELVSP